MTQIFEIYDREYKISICAQSQSNHSIGFFIPELKILFNAQIEPPFWSNYILLTHMYAEQCGSLHLRLKQDDTMKQMIVVPKLVYLSVQDYVTAMIGNTNSQTYVGVSNGDIIDLKQAHMYFQVYDIDNNIPCVGYGLKCRNHIIKPAYQNLSRRELIRLRHKGTVLTEVHHDPIVVYLTNTTNTIFDTYPDLLTYKYIIIDCTYLHITGKSDGMRMSWLTLYPVIQQYPNIIFILFNFSSKYETTDIFKFQQSITDENVRIVF